MSDVRAGRKGEVEYMQGRGIWSVVDVDECWRVTGRKPTSVKWVDTNKGTEEEPKVRCRLVARDFKGGFVRSNAAFGIETGFVVESGNQAAGWRPFEETYVCGC